MSDHLFQDIFTILDIDPDGKNLIKYVALVNRIVAKSEALEMVMHLDINTDIYPMHKGEKFQMELASTLNLDGTPDTGYFTQGNRKSLADKYEYVMQGKLYKITEDKRTRKADILASFGGLLMWLKGTILSHQNLSLIRDCLSS